MTEQAASTGHHDYGGSNTPAEHKDAWSTPQWLFEAINTKHRFVLDAAAEAHNSKCDAFISKAEDALEVDWHDRASQAGGNSVWVNPPYSRGMIAKFMAKAYEESQKGLTVVLLVPATPDAGWWPDSPKCMAFKIQFVTHGRINFVSAETGQIVRGNTKGSCIVEFNSSGSGLKAPFYGSVSRQHLQELGQPLVKEEEMAAVAPKPQEKPKDPIQEVLAATELDSYEQEEVHRRIQTWKQDWIEFEESQFPSDSQIAERLASMSLEVMTHGRRLKQQIRFLAEGRTEVAA